MRPTKEEVKSAMTTIDEICLFVAMRGLWDKPDPDVLKLWDWLREEFDLKVEENH